MVSIFLIVGEFPWKYKQRKTDVLPDVSAAYCITIYNDCYVSTYGIPYIFKKTHF